MALISPSNRLSSERFSFHFVSDTEVICDKDGVELLLHDGVLTCAARAIEELRQDGFFAAEAWQGRQIEITAQIGTRREA
jgi:hypothetical protein